MVPTPDQTPPSPSGSSPDDKSKAAGSTPAVFVSVTAVATVTVSGLLFMHNNRPRATDGSDQATPGIVQQMATDGAQTKPPSLQAVLDARTAESAAQMPEEVKADMQAASEELTNSGLVDQAVSTGDMAPAFELPDAKGATTSLAQLTAEGPVVLTWYRGGWCPYCNLQLRAYQDILPQIEATGARLVAITPETPDNSLSTVEKDNLEFTVLSDAGNAVASAYGLVFTLPDNLIERYRGFGIDLEQANGDDTWTLPLAATYVIDTDGTIAWAFVDADYRKRAEPADILAALERIAAIPTDQ